MPFQGKKQDEKRWNGSAYAPPHVMEEEDRAAGSVEYTSAPPPSSVTTQETDNTKTASGDDQSASYKAGAGSGLGNWASGSGDPDTQEAPPVSLYDKYMRDIANINTPYDWYSVNEQLTADAYRGEQDAPYETLIDFLNMRMDEYGNIIPIANIQRAPSPAELAQMGSLSEEENAPVTLSPKASRDADIESPSIRPMITPLSDYNPTQVNTSFSNANPAFVLSQADRAVYQRILEKYQRTGFFTADDRRIMDEIQKKYTSAPRLRRGDDFAQPGVETAATAEFPVTGVTPAPILQPGPAPVTATPTPHPQAMTPTPKEQPYLGPQKTMPPGVVYDPKKVQRFDEKYAMYSRTGASELYDSQLAALADKFGLEDKLTALEQENEKREADLMSRYYAHVNSLYMDPNIANPLGPAEEAARSLRQALMDEAERYALEQRNVRDAFAIPAAKIQRQDIAAIGILNELYQVYRPGPGDNVSACLSLAEKDFEAELQEISQNNLEILAMGTPQAREGAKRREAQLQYGLDELRYQRLYSDPAFEQFIGGGADIGKETTFEAVTGKKYSIAELITTSSEKDVLTQFMSTSQQRMAVYLKQAQGQEAVDEYFDHIKPVLRLTRQESVSKDWEEWGKEAPVGVTLLTVPLKVVGAISAMGQSVENLFTGDETGNQGYLSNIAVRSGRSGAKEKLGPYIGETGYDLIVNSADNLTTAATGPLAPYLFAAQAYGDKAVDTYLMGGEPWEVVALSSAAAAIDFGIDKLDYNSLIERALDPKTVAGKATQWLGASMAEVGSEDVLNSFVEYVVMRGESQITSKAQGDSDDKKGEAAAPKQAVMDLWNDFFVDVISNAAPSFVD